MLVILATLPMPCQGLHERTGKIKVLLTGRVDETRLIDELVEAPAITIPSAAKLLGVTPRAAQLNVDKLIDIGILSEATGRRRNRIFVAREIINTIEGEVTK